MRKFVWLFVLFLAACAPPTVSVTTTTPYNLVLPTPLPGDVRLEDGYPEPSTPAPLQTAVPTRQLANSWTPYRDTMHNIGLAYPAHWHQTVNDTTLFLSNQTNQSCAALQPLIELTFTGFALDANETTTSWHYGRLGVANRMVETLEEGFTGSYPSLLSIAKGENETIYTEILIRFTPETLLLIELNTPDARLLPDAQAIFNSLAAPDQPITIPAAPPTEQIKTCN